MATFDITSTLPSALGITTSSSTFSVTGIDFNYAIDSIPFMALASPDKPITRALAPIRKQQVDQSDNPGEQSLDSWWLRSQTDWSGGAGVAFLEPAADARVQRSFDSSAGINPWSIGELSLLRALTSQRTLTGSAASYVRKYSTTAATGLYFGSGSNIDRWDGTTWANTTGFSGTLSSLTAAGGLMLATNSTGTLYSATSGSTTFASLWTTSSGATRSWWVKQRLVVAQGPDLFELGLAGGNLDAQTPYYTHPDPNWTWSSAFEAPGAILVAGYGASGSAVYKFVLTTAGALPSISGAITTAELPIGEYITDGFSYLGAYVALATNRGVRVGTVDNEGNITYGPLTFTGATVGSFQAYERFVWIGVADAGEGRGGLIRIDLSDIGEDGRAPWANDVRLPSGVATSPQSLAVVTDEQVYIATAGSLYGCTTASNVEASGWLRTGYVRYGTIEPKNFESVRVDLSRPVSGSVTVYTVDKSGNESSMITLTESSDLESAIRVQFPVEPQKHLALKFTLTGSGTASPVLENWQMRAIPSPYRAELQQIQLMCFDFERDQNDQEFGYKGFALERWQALRDAVRDSRSIRFQNLTTGETTVCVVEDASFEQKASPIRESAFGGVVTVTVRSL